MRIQTEWEALEPKAKTGLQVEREHFAKLKAAQQKRKTAQWRLWLAMKIAGRRGLGQARRI